MFPIVPAGFTALIQRAVNNFNLTSLFLTFLKIGSFLFGSGYVLLALLHSEFVERLGWLTDTQIIDAVAVGQVTPGPLSTTATFLGFILGGIPGALLATLGMFLPSFLLVAITNPFIPRMRESKFFGTFLDGVNAGSLGLMTVVAFQLAQASFIDLPAVFLGLISFLLVLFTRINSIWLILGAVTIGLGRFFLGL